MSDMKLSMRNNKKLASIKMLSSGGHIRTPQFKKRDEDRDTDEKSAASEFIKYPHQDALRYENTYRTSPNEDQRFFSHAVEKLMKNILVQKLDGKKYDKAESGQLTIDISNEIKSRVKELKCLRHKVVVHVVLGQKAHQGMRIGCRCLWDDKNDNNAYASHETQDLVAVASCFGVYFE